MTEQIIRDGRTTIVVTTFNHAPAGRVIGKRYRVNVYLDLDAARFGSDAHVWERCELSAEQLATEMAHAKRWAADMNVLAPDWHAGSASA